MGINSKVVKIEQWRRRAQLSTTASGLGWDAKCLDLGDLETPCSFYICEPLFSNFTAMGVVDRNSLLKLFKGGTKKYGTNQQIVTNTGIFTKMIIDGEIESSPDNIKLLHFSHLLNFCNTQAAAQVLTKNETYKHFGSIMYLKSDDSNSITMRPIAASNKRELLSPDDVALMVCNYIISDYGNHPEYFPPGRSLNEILSGIVDKYPSLKAELGI